jgi:hypothetical protein
MSNKLFPTIILFNIIWTNLNLVQYNFYIFHSYQYFLVCVHIETNEMANLEEIRESQRANWYRNSIQLHLPIWFYWLLLPSYQNEHMTEQRLVLVLVLVLALTSIMRTETWLKELCSGVHHFHVSAFIYWLVILWLKSFFSENVGSLCNRGA